MAILPNHILTAFADAPGFDPETFAAAHAAEEQIVSLRLNERKPCTDFNFRLGEKVPWSSGGYYLCARPAFTQEPLLHAGAFYVQEASSMFLEQAVKQTCSLTDPLVVLDLCAAPGGKSTHLLSILSPETVLVSNEVIRSRSGILEENLVKWGAANTVITSNDPQYFSGIGAIFDLLIIDAPCSGSGMFRKDEFALSSWNENLVTLCSQRQRRIVADAWPSLKEGGVLVYSTCSYSVAENEALADFIVAHLGAESLPLQTNPDWQVVTSYSEQQQAAGYRFYAGKTRGEGFYLAAFRKTSTARSPTKQKTPAKWTALPQKRQSTVRQWLNNEVVELVEANGHLLALPPTVLQSLLYLPSAYIRRAGVDIGKLAGNGLVPDHALAVSHLVSANMPVLPLPREDALLYLRKENFNAGAAARGWTLVQYGGLGLGFLKQLGNRVNNYYPKEWRIRKPA
jgi:16S rRNA C967 or C1407 C5-methylase (RsmB/RsmF family)/NOL1/NOP2/fmu family ribosome biogenesis protein